MAGLLNIEIASINFAVSCHCSEIIQDSDPSYIEFLRTEKDPSAFNVDVRLKVNNIPVTGGMNRLFDSEQSWAIFTEGSDYFLALTPPVYGKKPVWIAQFRKDPTEITVFCGEMLINKQGKGLALSNPFRYPLDQLLLMYLLSQREGTILHAAGITINKKGYIFPGRSGAGKSTLSRLFIPRNGIGMLSDDRVIVRKMDGVFNAFGTPWPGEACVAVNKSAPLSGIFFISHGSRNKILDLDMGEAFERLLPVTSIPWYDKEMTEKLLVFCEDMVSHVPAYELYFKPNNEVVDVIGNFIGN